MYLQNLVNYTAAHSATMLLTAIILILILMIILLYGLIRLSGMESRYRALMRGSKHPDLEGMLLQHIKEVEVVGKANHRIIEENKLIRKFLRRTMVRTSVLRFRAFEDMGGDLSYAVAMLDASNNGMVFSSIFARDASRSYVKPIKSGLSEYPLTEEEEQVLNDAMGQKLPIQ